MAIYSIYSRGDEFRAIRDARFLRDGFSWAAFWLGPLFLLWHGLYVATAIWAAAFIVLIVVASTLVAPSAALTIFVLIQILLGLEAEDLLEGKLARKGYCLVDIVAAPNLDEAEVAFYRHHATASDGSLAHPEARP